MSDVEPRREYVWRPWKVIGLVAACLLVVAGALTATGGDGDAPTTPETVSAPPGGGASSGGRVDVPGARGFGGDLPPVSVPDADPVPGETPTAPAPASEEVDTDSPWSPALLRGGLSFLVGFALAYAARAFLKIAVFFLGVWAASLFLLSSLGWVEVHWGVIDAAFEGWSGKVGEQFESVRTFVTGSLPSAGMAGLGLVTGFRRK